MSFVYFAKNERGAIKIGTARDVNRRLSEIRVFSDVPVEIIGVMRGGLQKERDLHSQFASSKIAGEWFSYTKEISDYIQRNAKPHFPKQHGLKACAVTQDLHRASLLLREQPLLRPLFLKRF